MHWKLDALHATVTRAHRVAKFPINLKLNAYDVLNLDDKSEKDTFFFFLVCPCLFCNILTFVGTRRVSLVWHASQNLNTESECCTCRT